MLCKCVRLLASVGLAAVFSLATPSSALAQAYLSSTLKTFAVLGGTTSTCAGASVITGDVGVSPGPAIIGFPAPCTDTGTVRIPPDPVPAQGQLDLTTAYNDSGRAAVRGHR